MMTVFVKTKPISTVHVDAYHDVDRVEVWVFRCTEAGAISFNSYSPTQASFDRLHGLLVDLSPCEVDEGKFKTSIAYDFTGEVTGCLRSIQIR